MVSDRELLIQSLEKYVTKTVGSLFGITSLPAQALMRYGVRNMADKYGFILDMFTTSEGSINVPLMIDAAVVVAHASTLLRRGYQNSFCLSTISRWSITLSRHLCWPVFGISS